MTPQRKTVYARSTEHRTGRNVVRMGIVSVLQVVLGLLLVVAAFTMGTVQQLRLRDVVRIHMFASTKLDIKAMRARRPQVIRVKLIGVQKGMDVTTYISVTLNLHKHPFHHQVPAAINLIGCGETSM